MWRREEDSTGGGVVGGWGISDWRVDLFEKREFFN